VIEATALAAVDAINACGVTLLRAVAPVVNGAGPKLTKTFKQDANGAWKEAGSYGKAFLFDAEVFGVASTDDLLKLIRRASRVPQIALIRGRIKGGGRRVSGVRRLLHDRPEAAAHFEDAPSYLIPLDIDSVGLPDGLTLQDVDGVVAHVLSLLPPWMSDTTVIWQKTSGWGVKAGIRLRLYALSDVGLSSQDLKLLFAGYPVDAAVFGAAQLIYSAAPIFDGGEDPIGDRIGIKRGSNDRACVRAALEAAKAAASASHGGVSRSAWSGGGLGFDGYVSQIGDEPHIQGGRGFYEPIKAAVASAFAARGSSLDQGALIAQLSEIIQLRGDISGRPRDYIASRIRDLRGLVRSLQRMQAATEERDATAISGGFVDADPAGVVRPTLSIDEAVAGIPPASRSFFDRANDFALLALRRRAQERGATFESPATVLEGDAPPEASVGLGGTISEDDFLNAVDVSAINLPQPPHELILSDLGGGKTEIVARHAVAFVSSPREGMPPPRVGFIVNDHALAEGIAERLNAIQQGVAAVWRGLDRPDPEALGESMCRRSRDMATWRRAGGSRSDMCRSCPFGNAAPEDGRCGYIKQRRDAPITILAGPNALSSQAPAALNRKMRMNMIGGGRDTVSFHPFDLVIVDETRAQDWVGGFGARPFVADVGIASGELRPPCIGDTNVYHWTRVEWQDLDDRLTRVDRMIAKAVSSLSHGQMKALTFGDLRCVFPDEVGWLRLRTDLLNMQMRVNQDVAPLIGKSLADELEGASTWNGRVKTLARLCFAAAQCEGARNEKGECFTAKDEAVLLTAMNNTAAGSGIRIRWREDVHHTWRGMPILVLDATASVDLLRVFLPNLSVVAEGRAKLPDAVTVWQVSDTLAPASSWTRPELGEDATDAAKARDATARRNAARVRRTIEVLAEATREDGGVGFVGPKRLVEEMRRQWGRSAFGMPQGVVLGHYGAIRGRDDFKGVRVFIDFSRPAPPPYEVEGVAEAIVARPVQRLPRGEWYDRGKGRHHIMAGGGVVPALKSETHPDPIAEDVRRQITDAELDQADHRSRALRRSKPLLLIRATAAPSDRLIINKLVKMDDVLPFTELDQVAARGLIVPTGNSNPGAWELLAAAIGVARAEAADGGGVGTVSANAVRVLVAEGGSHPKDSLIEELPMGFLRVRAPLHGSSTPAAASVAPKGFSSWRVKATHAARYATTVHLKVSEGDDRAARDLLKKLLGAEPACVDAPTGKRRHRKKSTQTAEGEARD
jgi:hypothetical protein